MSRTRKFIFVKQNAERLAALGLSPAEIAKDIGVNKSTITRWFKVGKLKRPEPNALLNPAQPRQSPAEWAKSMREEFLLSSTDEQLVTLGEQALSLTRDVTVSAPVQLAAGAQFRAIAKQLAIVTSRAAAVASLPTAVNETPRRPVLVRKPIADARKSLMGIK